MLIFEQVDGEFKIKEEFLAMEAVQNMMRLNYNKGWPGDADGRKRTRAHKEFAYIHYGYNYRSEFANYPEKQRHVESLKAAGLPEDYEISAEMFEAIGVLSHHFNEGNRVLNLLESARNVVDKLHKYFNSVEFTIDEKDKLDVKKMKSEMAGKVMDNLGKIPKVIKDLDTIEERVRKEQNAGTKIRGDAEQGRLQ